MTGLANAAPLPVLTAENRAFWTGGAAGRLLIMRCTMCGRLHHPPAPLCPYCLADAVAPEAVSGRGILASFTINHQRWQPEMRVPFVIGLVELAEQRDIRLTTNIVRQPVDEVRIGQRLRVLFERHEDVWLPLFEPDGAPA